MAPRYTGINHLAMATGDIDATIRFWRDLLGMRLVAGAVTRELGGSIEATNDGGAKFVIRFKCKNQR